MNAGNWGAFEQVPAQHSGPTIQEIQSLAQLVTEKVNVSDVMETRLNGKTGSIRVLVVVKGNVLVSTDLAQAHFDAINETTRSVVLVLPQPKVCQVMVDHEQTRVFAISETGLWQVTPNDNAASAAVIDLAYRDAQRFVADAAKDNSLLVRARQHTEQVLGEFLRAEHWQLSVRWSE
jgi:hypothetical protein